MQLNAKVVFITSEKFSFVLKDNPYIDKIVSYEQIGQVNDVKFDYILDLHKNIRSRRIRSKLRGKVLDFDKQNIEKWILVNFKKNILTKLHLVDRYFLAFESIGIINDGKGLDYFYPNDSSFEIPNEPYVVINCGGTYFTKRIPPTLIDEIVKQSPIKVFLLGGRDVKDLSLQLTKDAKLVNLIDKTTLTEAAYLIKASTLLITSDSALMHIGAALDVSMSVVWGNTVPSFGMYPYQPKDSKETIVHCEVKELSCRPCSKIGFASCKKKHFKCMNNQSVKTILSPLNQHC